MSIELYRIDDPGGNDSSRHEYWMTNLPPPIRQLPLMYMCIPGSYASSAYSVFLESDQPKYQDTNIAQQLKHGIRHINCTVHWNSDMKAWMCDKYTSLVDIIRQINIFAMLHTDELILFEVKCRSKDDINCIGVVLNRLSHVLFEKTPEFNPDKLWYSQYSMYEICRTGHNVVFINNWFSYINNIFSSHLKHLTTQSTNDLETYLPLAEIAIFETFKIPSYLLQVNWTPPKFSSIQSKCCKKFCEKRRRRQYSSNYGDNATENAHNTLKEYIHNSPERCRTFLEKIFILSVEYEAYIDVVELCLILIKYRFFQ
jgi:hypothetical protein